MKLKFFKITGLLAIAGLIVIGCDNIVDHNSSNTMILEEKPYDFLHSVNGSVLLDPFTQDELDNNWVEDRRFPTGGVLSVSFGGRENVAKIGVIGAEQDQEPFRQFEGIKKVDDFGFHVQVDLFVPSEWQDADVVNVGFWSSDDPISSYPLIVYRNSAAINAGFYTWDGIAGYIESGIQVNYDDWNTLAISLDTDNQFANYSINSEDAGGITATGNNIGQVFLNHYNDGARDYFAYWHVGILDPETRSDCMQGGWEAFGFRNQGQCIRFVNTGQDSR